MAYYFLFPENDTTIYSHPNRDEMNTGNDEILELVKERGNTDQLLYPSRILIKFKNEDIQSVIKDTIGSTKFETGTSASLKLYSATGRNIATTMNINVYALSQSFDEGTGKYSNLPTSSNLQVLLVLQEIVFYSHKVEVYGIQVVLLELLSSLK